MNLQQLEYIIAVDTHKHFGKASEACFVTQATLSAMIKKLEQELGVVIFDRKSHPIVTTDCGQEIVEHARKVIKQASLLKESAQGILQRISGEITIGIIPTVSSSLLPIILRPILTKYPQLSLKVKELTTANIISQLKTTELDMGILATPLQLNEIEENILYYEALLVYGKADGMAGKKYVYPHELTSQKIWLLEEGNCLRNQSMDLCQIEENSQLPGMLSFEASSLDTLLHLTDRLGGLTIVPELYQQFLQPQQAQSVIPFEMPVPVREISLVYYRPFAKFRIINSLTEEIRQLVKPLLSTIHLRNDQMDLIQVTI